MFGGGRRGADDGSSEEFFCPLNVYGRSKAYESIIKKTAIVGPKVPESFNVLVKELQGLGLKVDLVHSDQLVDAEDVHYVRHSLPPSAVLGYGHHTRGIQAARQPLHGSYHASSAFATLFGLLIPQRPDHHRRM